VTQSPLPSPNPTASAVFVSSVLQNVLVTSGATFNGIPNLVDYDITETDTGLYGILNVRSWLTDVYYGYAPAPNGQTAFSTVGQTSWLDLGSIDQTFFKTEYGPGNGLIDVIPEPSHTGQAVPILPANNAALTTREKDPDGQVTTRVVNPDGSYTEQATFPDGTSSTATLNANGTGVYSFPLYGVQPNSSVLVGGVTGGNIPVTVNYAAGTDGPTSPPSQVNYSIPNWYPETPPVLSKETYVNYGPKILPNPYPSPTPLDTPGACNLGQNNQGVTLTHIQGKPYSNDLIQTITKVDPIFGETETTTTSTLVTQGVGATCWEILDVVNQYYDYSGQTYKIPYFGNAPVQTSTTDITMGIAFATINNQSYRFGDANGRRNFFDNQGLPNGRQPGSMMRHGRTFGHQGQGLTRNPSGSSSQPSDALLVLRGSYLHALEDARLKRHAAYWRQMKALRDRWFRR
jgi:hypothetical protein